MAFEIWAAMLSAAADVHYDYVLGDGKKVHLKRQLLALLLGRSNHSYPAIIIALADKITSKFDGSARRFQQLGVELQQELENAMGPNGIILHPPYIRPAPRHHVPFLSPLAPAYTAIFNVMEFPVTQVPIRLSKKGLPVGVQVVGSRGCDGLTLAVAEALETDFGGWIPASMAGHV